MEIRHLHRSEVAEVAEGFSQGQKGSSTMPHKKNPIAAENLTGMARILRSHGNMALENCVLWHERDISHSCNERLYLPDNFGLLVYALRRLAHTLENLVVDEAVISARVEKNFHYLSSCYLHHLIRHLELSREECYAVVQDAAFAAVSGEDFHRRVLEGVEKKHCAPRSFSLPGPKKLEQLYLKEVDALFECP